MGIEQEIIDTAKSKALKRWHKRVYDDGLFGSEDDANGGVK